MVSPKPLRDPQVLRAIAHPVRNRILDELGARGSMRAADVAAVLDVPANQASFHLRQLAKYGLVEEDPEAARDKRDRVWKVASEGGYSVNFGDVEAEPGGAAATAVFRRTASEWGQYVVRQAYEGERGTGAHRSVNNSALLLTADEARQLSDELSEVVGRWSTRTRDDHGPDAPERETYVYLGTLQPHPGSLDSGKS